MAIYKHYSAYGGPWPWQNFTPREVACRHCGELYVDEAAMNALQALRKAWGKPITVNSGHRCKAHNKAVGGKPASMHLRVAFDCLCPAPEQAAFVRAAEQAGFTGIGVYKTRGFVHLDMGKKRRW